jgi:predicted PurR-regulated permease PerM
MKGNLNTTQLFQLLLILLLLVWCFLIVQPFILLLVWAIILAVALYPLYNRIASRFSEGKRKWATTLFALILALLLFIPLYYLVDSIVSSSRGIVEQLQEGTFQIPGPDPSVSEWPVIGERLYGEWAAFSQNTQQYAIDHKEVILDKGGSLLKGLGGFFGSLILFVVSFLIAVVFMHNSEKGWVSSTAFLKKVVGDKAPEILLISRDTIRSVVKGILLVALIQALLALIGLQISFSTMDTTGAVIFTVYMVAISLSDNILKPVLLGKGLQTPIIIILIGSIGGMLLHGIIGLFVGAVVLAVAHRLYSFWIQAPLEID